MELIQMHDADGNEVSPYTQSNAIKTPSGMMLNDDIDTKFEETNREISEIKATLIETKNISLTVSVAGQVDLGVSEWATSSRKIVSAISSGTYLLIPFVYGGRWFLKALNSDMSQVGAGTNIGSVTVYYKNT